VQRISVVLIDMAPMLREIVREAVSAEAHIDVVRDFRDPIDLLTVVERHEPDVVITGMEANRDECVVEALHTSPRLRIIGLAQDGRTLHLHQLAWRRLEVRGVSSECLLDAIRGTTEAKGASECQLH
jgi:chemotaxis response regulator CheB